MALNKIILIIICLCMFFPLKASYAIHDSKSYNSKTYYNKGIAKQKLSKHNDAIKDFNKAIELNPNDYNYFLKRGISRIAIKKYQTALNDFDIVLMYNPNNAQAYCNRAIVETKLEDYKKAIEDFNKAIELKPDYALAYSGRGAARASLNIHNDAIKDFNTAIKLNSKSYEAYLGKADIYFKMGDYTRAELYYKEAFEIKPTKYLCSRLTYICRTSLRYKEAFGYMLEGFKLSIIEFFRPAN